MRNATMTDNVDRERASVTKPDATVPGEDLIRRGDAHAEAGDWVGAVARWRAGAAAGAERAAKIRLRAFLHRFGGGPGAAAGAGVPRRALGPLAVCLEASVLGGLALFAADRPDGATDPILLGLGWLGVVVAAGSALVFAARSGRLDGGAGATLPESVPLDELIGRAEELAARLTPSDGAGTGPGAVAVR